MKKEKAILVRVSVEEEKILKDKATSLGLKLSTYLRSSGLTRTT